MIIGPFTDGLNTFDDPSSIRDTELVEARNFDVGLDGSLVGRPPFVTGKYDLSEEFDSRFNVLGMYTSVNGVQYMIYSSQVSLTYILNLTNGNLTYVPGLAATDMVQFDDKAWLLSGDGSQTGGWWNPGSGFTAVSSMPKGRSIVSYKSRLFVSNGISYPTRMYYSKVLGQSGFWSNPSYLEISAGDGQRIVKLVSHFDSILVFRTNSIWEYQYTSDPASATSYVLSPGVGLENRFSLDVHESYLYFLFNGGLYEFANNKANKINDKIEFKTDGALQAEWDGLSVKDVDTPVSVSTFNGRILVCYYETIYVYHLRTRTWTTWNPELLIRQVFSRPQSDQNHVGYAISARRSRTYYNIFEARDENRAEEMTCSITTKTFSFRSPGTFKVLFWWGIDALFNGRIRGYVIPVTYAQRPSWSRSRIGHTWTSVGRGSWRMPFISDGAVETAVESSGESATRKFVKAIKKLRFRQISFRVEVDTQGTPETPVRLFTLSAYMTNKQTVNDQVS